MGDMQAAKVVLQRMAPLYEAQHLKFLESVDRDTDEEYDYLEKHKLKFLNGVVYSANIQELDSCGFITKTENENGSIEIVALWYNGGAHINEVLEEGLRNEEF